MRAAEQARAFLVMALCGAACGAVCDVMALLRRILRGGALAAGLCDLAGGALLAAGMTAAGLYLRMDPFRLYAIAGAGAGFLLWRGTAGRLWRHLWGKIAQKDTNSEKKAPA